MYLLSDDSSRKAVAVDNDVGRIEISLEIARLTGTTISSANTGINVERHHYKLIIITLSCIEGESWGRYDNQCAAAGGTGYFICDTLSLLHHGCIRIISNYRAKVCSGICDLRINKCYLPIDIF